MNRLIYIVTIVLISTNVMAQVNTKNNTTDVGFYKAHDVNNILPVRARYQYMNEVIDWRIKHLLPNLMEKHGIDAWLISYRENNIDPVAATFGAFGANVFLGRTYLFHNQGAGKGVKRYPIQMRYPADLSDLKALVKKLNPKTIGINTSKVWNTGDGLSKALYDRFVKVLGKDSKRLVSAENLSNEWLELKTERELTAYRHVIGVAHDVISEAFSNKAIIPGVTTVNDLSWWIEQRYADLGLNGLYAIIELQRSPKDRIKYGNPAVGNEFNPADKLDGDIVIQRGDIIHSDVGMEYIGLNTDQQHHVYILREGESDVPEGLKKALKRSNRLQDIFMGHFKEGRSGNEITGLTREQAAKENLKCMVYTHPIGYHQHGGGTIMGADTEFSQHNKLPRGAYPMSYNAVWSIELETISKIPEWDNIEVEIAVEEEGAFTKKQGAYFIDGRQTKWFLVH